MSTINRIHLRLLVLFLCFFSGVPGLFAAAGSNSNVPNTRYDFDGDGRAEIAVWRPENGVWFRLNTSDGTISAVQFGVAGDIPQAADFDGDGMTDLGVFRPSNGVWYLQQSQAGFAAFQFGVTEDEAVTGDYDGDGKSDAAVFRPSNGVWYIFGSTDGFRAVQFGISSDVPVPADYDGDGRTDIAVYRDGPQGIWHVLRSSDGYFAAQFGSTNDVPVPGDFDGDLKADLAVWRPSDRNWFVLRSTGGTSVSQFGITSDIPIPADFDGDQKADVGVFRSENGYWHIIRSQTNGYSQTQFGISVDIPVTAQDGWCRRRCRERSGGTTPTPTPTPTPIPTPSPTPTPTATPTPTPTPTATPTPTPSPTPTPTPTPTPSPGFACDYYAAPNGTSSGSGSSSSPWDLQTGLTKTSQVRSGKTLCMRGGTYRGKFVSTLNGGGIVRSAPGEWAVIDGFWTTTLSTSINSSQGTLTVGSTTSMTPGNTISIDNETMQVAIIDSPTTLQVVRPWDGTQSASHAAGATVYLGGNQLTVSGSNTMYRDFEVMNSGQFRDDDSLAAKSNKIGVFNTGSGNSFVNLIVHDNNGGGFFNGSSSSNTLIYGSLSYNNGSYSSGSGRIFGHGFYLENASGYSRVYESLSLNSFNLGAQLYGVSGPFVGGDLRGFIAANSGSPMQQKHLNLIWGPDSQPSPTANLDSSVFYHNPGGGYSVQIGYGAGVSNATISNNYFLGGGGSGTALEVTSNVPSATVTGNKFDNTGSGNYVNARDVGYTWNNNHYYSTSATTSSRLAVLGVGGFTFNNWRSTTGYDLSGNRSDSPMPDTGIVRPNSYQTGRANIIVYAPSLPSSISVDLAPAGLANGQSFIIKNAFNYNGPAVATGVFNSGSPTFSLPLNTAAKSVAKPVGMATTPSSTCPRFCAFVLIPN